MTLNLHRLHNGRRQEGSRAFIQSCQTVYLAPSIANLAKDVVILLIDFSRAELNCFNTIDFLYVFFLLSEILWITCLLVSVVTM